MTSKKKKKSLIYWKIRIYTNRLFCSELKIRSKINCYYYLVNFQKNIINNKFSCVMNKKKHDKLKVKK